MLYTVASQSYIGGRTRNEDRVSVSSHDDAVLMVVADGLGGHAGGDIASQGLIDAMVQFFERTPLEKLNNPATFLQLAIEYSHSVIHHRATENKLPPHVPKTTCVACLVIDGIAQWAHTGDSRLYLYRDGRMVYRTEDHAGEPIKGNKNNTISRYVGGYTQAVASISPKVQLEHNDMILLCSDGVWQNIESADVMKHIEPAMPQNGLNNLLRTLEARNQKPGDNLSAIVLCWGAHYANSNNNDEKDAQIDLLDSTEPAMVPDNTSTELPPSEVSESPKQSQMPQDLESMIEELENLVERLAKSP